MIAVMKTNAECSFTKAKDYRLLALRKFKFAEVV